MSRVLGSADQPARLNLRAFMARRSVVVRLTPRQAVAAAHVLEEAAAAEYPSNARLWAAAANIHIALGEAGWLWNADTETWEHAGPPAAVPDPC